jgi:hypothetical protein
MTNRRYEYMTIEIPPGHVTDSNAVLETKREQDATLRATLNDRDRSILEAAERCATNIAAAGSLGMPIPSYNARLYKLRQRGIIINRPKNARQRTLPSQNLFAGAKPPTPTDEDLALSAVRRRPGLTLLEYAYDLACDDAALHRTLRHLESFGLITSSGLTYHPSNVNADDANAQRTHTCSSPSQAMNASV